LLITYSLLRCLFGLIQSSSRPCHPSIARHPLNYTLIFRDHAKAQPRHIRSQRLMSDMPFELTLPAELWLKILDMAIDAGITLLEQCDHTSFLDIYYYLYSSSTRAPFDNSYGQLRLVCRMFNALLGSSPHYIMKSSCDAIPTSARAVYIIENKTPSEHVRRLLEEPSICHRLFHLDTITNRPGLPNASFDVLCENSRSLPNLRCLTLRFGTSSIVDLSFWAQLNDAFPLLRRLVLLAGYCNRSGVLQSDITFRNVELLISDIWIPHIPRFHFPRLRHVALASFIGPGLGMLAGSPLLESAIFGNVHPGTMIDLKVFPLLRFLRIRAWEAYILPVSDGHPLEHLYLIVGVETPSSSDTGLYTVMITKSLPGVSRITLYVCASLKPGVERQFQRIDLRSIGFSLSIDDYHIVLNRRPKMSG
jgi:hypothetical protein